MLVLGAVIDQEQETGRRQPLDEAVQEGVRLAGLFSFRIGVANQAQNELKGFVPCGALLTRHTPHDPKPFDEGQS